MASLLNGNGFYPVTAQQDADLYQGIVGGDYVKVLPIGDQMAYELTGGNEVTISNGECIDTEGRRIHINVGESDVITIPTGTTGTTKYYIIGYKITTDSSGNETAETFYEQVSSATSTISENTLRSGYSEKYISLYRLTQAGVSITNVEALFTVVSSLSDANENIETLQTDLSTAENSIEEIQDDIEDLQEDLSTANTNISTLQEDLSSVSDTVEQTVEDYLPFKLGISEDGTYGYIKDGETEVTGFRNPTGDATPADVLDGVKFSSADYEDEEGTMPIIEAEEVSLNAGQSYTPAYGFHDGNSVITAASLASQMEGTGESSDVKTGVSVYIDGVLTEGTMTENGTVSATLDAGESYELTEGHYDGGTITANDLASQTEGTAKAADITDGETAWVDGVLITGTMDDNGAVNVSLDCGESYTIDEGHYDSGTVSANSLASQTIATATAADILDGETAWVNGSKITGTMDDNGAVNVSLDCGESYAIDEGHYDSGTVSANSLASQTIATANAADIISGETAWVNGSLVTGALVIDEDSGSVSYDTHETVNVTISAGETYEIESGLYETGSTVTAATIEEETAGTATADDLADGKTAWVSGEEITGTLTDHDVVTVELAAGESYTIEEGIYREGSEVTAQDLASQTEATATAETIAEGYTAWVNGVLINGTMAESTVVETINGEETDDGVNFVSLYGNTLYAYSWDELLELSALPDTVDIETTYGTTLEMTGWNWTLAQLKTVGNGVQGRIDVGGEYMPEDGKTVVIVDVPYSGSLQLNFGAVTTDDIFSVNWGDGSAEAIGNQEADYVILTHDYENTTKKRYTVKISVSSGSCTLGTGTVSISEDDDRQGNKNKHLSLVDGDNNTAKCLAIYTGGDGFSTASYYWAYNISTLKELTYSEAIDEEGSYATNSEVLEVLSYPKTLEFASYSMVGVYFAGDHLEFPYNFNAFPLFTGSAANVQFLQVVNNLYNSNIFNKIYSGVEEVNFTSGETTTISVSSSYEYALKKINGLYIPGVITSGYYGSYSSKDFSTFPYLVELTNIQYIGSSCDFTNCKYLSEKSVKNLVAALADQTSYPSSLVEMQTLTLSSDAYSYLTEDEINEALNKYWYIVNGEEQDEEEETE